VAGIFIDFALWFEAFSLLGVIDEQMGLTLLYVEVPIGVLVGIVSSILRESARQAKLARSFAQETQRLQDRRIRITELEEQLTIHYQDILHTMQFWFEDSLPTISPFDGPKMTYTVLRLGAAYWYSPPQRTELKTLEIRVYVRDLAAEVEEHLGGHEWQRWVSLREKTNANLTRVKKAWANIEGDIRSMTNELGLTEWDGSLASGKPVNYYWMHFLLPNIWMDSQYSETNKEHIWDHEGIAQADDDYNRKKVWQLDNVWAQSESKDVLERLKKWLTIESEKVHPLEKEIREESKVIETDFEDLLKAWRSIEKDYRRKRVRRLPNSCPTCRPWLTELESLDVR
jgi:hypothetical protein